jgi:hypothetical protein
MRASLSVLTFSFCLSAQPVANLQHAITGAWVGTLEYRDFSEPATSTKRVKLPAWRDVETSGADLRFHYV